MSEPTVSLSESVLRPEVETLVQVEGEGCDLDVTVSYSGSSTVVPVPGSQCVWSTARNGRYRGSVSVSVPTPRPG